jgi:hypothetical protein
MDECTFATEAFTLYLPLTAFVLFVGAYGLGIILRRARQIHARFMACTALLLVDPVLGRTMAFYLPELPALWCYQVITFGIACTAAGFMLRTLPRGATSRRAYARFVGAFVVVLGLWFVLPYTSPWMAIATAFRALPLT